MCWHAQHIVGPQLPPLSLSTWMVAWPRVKSSCTCLSGYSPSLSDLTQLFGLVFLSYFLLRYNFHTLKNLPFFSVLQVLANVYGQVTTAAAVKIQSMSITPTSPPHPVPSPWQPQHLSLELYPSRTSCRRNHIVGSLWSLDSRTHKDASEIQHLCQQFAPVSC